MLLPLPPLPFSGRIENIKMQDVDIPVYGFSFLMKTAEIDKAQKKEAEVRAVSRLVPGL